MSRVAPRQRVGNRGLFHAGVAPLAFALPPSAFPSRLSRGIPLFWLLLANLHHKDIRITAQGWL